MSRLEKKCFVASAGTHALLFALLALTSAFGFSKKPRIDLPVLTFLPSVATDERIVSGGSPTARPPAAPPKVENVQPASPEPQPAEVKPPETVQETPPVTERKPERVIPEPVKTPKPDVTTARDKIPPKPVDTSANKAQAKSIGRTNMVTSSRRNPPRSNVTPSAQSTAQAEAQARAQAQRQLASRIGQAVGSLERGLTPGTSVEVPGPGGAAFANYGLLVQAAYQLAWLPPQEVAAQSAVVRARVVIQRSGRVTEARVEKPCGIPAVDKSVERALELKSVEPFPEGAKDTERTFIINFDLKTKQPFG